MPGYMRITFPELKAQIHSEQDNLQKINLLKEADRELSEFSPYQQAEYWFLLGKSLETERLMSDARAAFTKGIDIYSSNNLSISSLLINLLHERARVSTNLDHQNSTSCEDREQALTYSRELKDPSLTAKSISYYAKCLQNEEHGIAKSLTLFDEAFDIAQNQQLDSSLKIIIFNQASTLYFRALIYDKAYEYNMLAYNLSRETTDTNSTYNMLLNAIHYSIALVDITLAKQHLTQLSQWHIRYPQFKGAQLKFYYLSAKVAQLEKNWPLSTSFLEEGLKEVHDSQNVSYVQATYELLSIAYFRVGEIEKSFNMLSLVETMFPDRKPIKKERLLIKGMMINNPTDIVNSAFELIDKERQLKNNFVKQTAIQSAKLFDENLNQLDNIILEQRLTIVTITTMFIVVILIVFLYLQIQRKKLAQHKHHLMDELLAKKNQLLSDVSHELSTPLTVLKLQVESLKDDLEEDVQASYDALDNKITDIEYLIDDIHQLAQSDVGALQLNVRPFELNIIFDLWEKELRQLVNKNKLTFEITKDFPCELMINLDQDRIKQIMTNLLSNCIKYTDKPGRVSILATTRSNTFYLSIEDSAPAVSDKDLNAIFERLYRVENSRSRETGGSGLGLAICKSLIELHNGTIHAEKSSLGGLKIVISLPL
ncbi:hypothetical protein CXF85_22520 [Colwellia sp. 75C3]|nr:hypothetical protein CXF85_22520 [Colwellia sp. 75C3]